MTDIIDDIQAGDIWTGAYERHLHAEILVSRYNLDKQCMYYRFKDIDKDILHPAWVTSEYFKTRVGFKIKQLVLFC